ncbi:MAG: hypothetical protein KDK23_00795 [Leptospiraceae bacterium]|nr:hypothetical protein [Leptospiraceae bacterium]
MSFFRAFQNWPEVKGGLFAVALLCSLWGVEVRAEEPGPNELQISLGLGPSNYASQMEPRIQNEFLFGGFLLGGAGFAEDWKYSGSSGQRFRLAYLRNSWLFELEQQTYNADIAYTSFVQGTINSATVARATLVEGELEMRQTGLLAGFDWLQRKNSDLSIYLLFGFRSVDESFLNEHTAITSVSSGTASVIVPGASPVNETLIFQGALYSGFDIQYRYSAQITLQLRLGLESGTGDWESTELLYGTDGSFDFRREIGETSMGGLQLDFGMEYALNPDWSLFLKLQSHRLWLQTSRVLPLTANSSGITDSQRLQDLILTYNGARHEGRTSAVVMGFTYRYHFW